MTQEEAINQMNSYKRFENTIFEHKKSKEKVLLESVTYGMMPKKNTFVNYCNFIKLEANTKRIKTVKLLEQFFKDYKIHNRLS